jgi:hypothetical protein
MRRLAGAWLFFLLIVIIKHGGLFRALPPSPPLERTGLPATVTSSPLQVAPAVPAGFAANPLFYFSKAPRDSLILLPGIGPVLADRIINARGGKRLFKTWDDLLTVKGIGAKKVEKFKRLAGKK